MDALLNAAESRELISFRIGEQEFCVDIICVREIRGWTPATPVPHAPAYVRGVINLRGTVMPVVDLSARLGLGVSEPTARHVIIVARIGARQSGLLVDAVCETLAVKASDIQPMPEIGSEMSHSIVKGFLQVEDRMISLISLESLLEETLAEAA